MNPYKHSEISVNKRGGKIEDYYPIHSFMDSTKELCSDNRHRILHNLWGVRRIIIPIFGYSITNSEGKVVNVKDICEQDHILPDFRNKFIPTLQDFVDSMQLKDDKFLYTIENIAKKYQNNGKISELLLSPLILTGELKSLLITHNSWFINEIIPAIFNEKIEITNDLPSPFSIFENMRFRLWMDNGLGYPKSASAIENIIKSKTVKSN